MSPTACPTGTKARARSGGSGGAAVYQVDGRDVVTGNYEAVVVAPTAQAINVGVQVTQSPLRLRLSRNENEAVATLSNATTRPVRAEVAMLLGGGERVETVIARGSAVHRIPFIAPAWAKSVVVDITMDRAQWGRFTDFGVTLFDSAGRQIEKQPQNYAVGRLQAALPKGHGDMRVELGLFPGFADSTIDDQWTLRATIRLYADSAAALSPRQLKDSTVTIAPGASASTVFPTPESPWPLGDRFFPLGILVARSAEHIWTREGGLPLPNPPVAR